MTYIIGLVVVVVVVVVVNSSCKTVYSWYKMYHKILVIYLGNPLIGLQNSCNKSNYFYYMCQKPVCVK
jgi:hypothetical protein